MPAEHRSGWQELWETVRAILLAVLAALLIRQFVVETYRVNGISMEPTLQNNERLLVNKFIYRFTPPHVGQIIIFHPPLPTPAQLASGSFHGTDTCHMAIPSSEDFVKRVIAVAGQTFAMRNGVVYINGQAQAEPWLPTAWRDHYTTVHPSQVKIPPGDVWVLGDHRAASLDSRCFGPVPISSIKGQAMLVWWPLGNFRILKS